MSDVKIDWTSDEEVLRAVYPNLWVVGMCATGAVWTHRSPELRICIAVGLSTDQALADARQHPTVLAFERAHRPASEVEAAKKADEEMCLDCDEFMEYHRAFGQHKAGINPYTNEKVEDLSSWDTASPVGEREGEFEKWWKSPAVGDGPLDAESTARAAWRAASGSSPVEGREGELWEKHKILELENQCLALNLAVANGELALCRASKSSSVGEREGDFEGTPLPPYDPRRAVRDEWTLVYDSAHRSPDCTLISGRQVIALVGQLRDARAALASKPSPDGEFEKWCVPNGETPKWLLRFEDTERGDALYEHATEAREAFAKASINWNCYLFAPALASKPSAEGPERPKPVGGLVQNMVWLSDSNDYARAVEALLSAKDAELTQLRNDAKHYEDERRSLADFMDRPEPTLPISADALTTYMEYSCTCQCRVCAHCRLMLSMLERAEAAEAELSAKDAEIAAGRGIYAEYRTETNAALETAEAELSALKLSSARVRDEALREAAKVVRREKIGKTAYSGTYNKAVIDCEEAILSLIPTSSKQTEEGQ